MREVLAGAAEAGAETEVVRLCDLQVDPCRACNGCRGGGICVMEDDMQELVAKMGRSCVWLLGTPVYWWGPTAQFKAFLDCWYVFDRERDFFGRRRVVFVVPLGRGESYARHTVRILEDVSDYLGMDRRGPVLAPGSGAARSVRERQEVLRRARDAGWDAAS